MRSTNGVEFLDCLINCWLFVLGYDLWLLLIQCNSISGLQIVSFLKPCSSYRKLLYDLDCKYHEYLQVSFKTAFYILYIYLVVDTTKSNFFTPCRTADVSIISPRQIVQGQELVMCLKYLEYLWKMNKSICCELRSCSLVCSLKVETFSVLHHVCNSFEVIILVCLHEG